MKRILRNLIFFRKSDLGTISLGVYPFALTIHYPYNSLQYNLGIEISMFSISLHIMLDENYHYID